MAEKKKMGRPKTQISKDIFEELCKIQCTEVEMIGVFRCCEDTLNAWCKENYGKTFSETYKIYSQDGKKSLRRIQFDLAKKYPAMAIFLGKQYLGQRDTVEVEHQSNGILTDIVEALNEYKENK